MFTRIISNRCLCRSIFIPSRYKSQSTSKAVTKSDANNHSQLDVNVKSTGERIKETGKSASYLGVILLGVGITGTLMYAVFRELFSSNSPNNIYTAAVKKCLANTKVEDKLGAPISAYGAETRRGRRQHPSYNGFIGQDGRKHIRMVFYLKGTFQKGTAHLEMIENDSGTFECLYLLVECNDLLNSVITVEDNRQKSIHNSNYTENNLLY